MEVLIAATLLSVAMLALGAAAGQSIKRGSLSANEVDAWTDLGRLTDSLIAVGWAGVTSGSKTYPHYAFKWSVASPGANLKRVDLVVERRAAIGQGTRSDSLTLYLARPVP